MSLQVLENCYHTYIMSNFVKKTWAIYPLEDV